MRDAAIHVDALGYDTLWTWDHVYPISGPSEGPILEGWMILAGWAGVTSQVRLGLMVGANTLRNPAIVAKMATTLDHISNGRAILGIGAGWFEAEHLAFGANFGGSPGERLKWLDEAVQIMRGMLRNEEPSGREFYSHESARNVPSPVQHRLPILVGGDGERKTLRTVARYADACNIDGRNGVDFVQHKDGVLRQHCAEIGRDHEEIERTVGMGVCIIRDNAREAMHAARSITDNHGPFKPETSQLIGSPSEVAETLRPLLRIGFRHVIVGFPSPHDTESMERLVREVKPQLT
jgi:alkanesulfonate monooxygenase SsuD/methylene tetrahydromethanopterin reductase-like flavin-dependent oxidoreductase (luciferase family)